MTHFDLRSVTILQYSIIRGFYALVNIVSFQTHNLGTVSRARHKERQEADLKMQREARAEQNSLSFIMRIQHHQHQHSISTHPNTNQKAIDTKKRSYCCTLAFFDPYSLCERLYSI
jgi:hypothetical protein